MKANEMNENLKPCPFCDCFEPRPVVKTFYFFGSDRFVVKCPNCNAKGPDTFKSAEEAVRLWNEAWIE